MNKIKRYKLNKLAKINEELVCPSCGSKFIKTNYQQVFCRTKPKTQCKDKFWNTVDERKRCNVTRISPASAAYMERKENHRYYYEHPFSCEGLGQWLD